MDVKCNNFFGDMDICHDCTSVSSDVVVGETTQRITCRVKRLAKVFRQAVDAHVRQIA